MTYSTPQLQIIGSAKTLVRGATPGGQHKDSAVGCQGIALSRDEFDC